MRLRWPYAWRLQAIEATLGVLIERITRMALSLEALRAAVAANTSVDQSAITLLTGLSAKIQELIDRSGDTVDPAELQAVVDALTTDNAALAAAVAANTPADPTA